MAQNFFQSVPNFYNANPLQNNNSSNGGSTDPFAGSNLFDPFAGSSLFDPFAGSGGQQSQPNIGNPSTLGLNSQKNNFSTSTPNIAGQPGSGAGSLTPIKAVTSQPIKPNYGGLSDIYGKNAQAAESAQLSSFFNQQGFQALGPSYFGAGPTEQALNDPLSQRGSLPNPGVQQQARMIDSGQLTGAQVGAGQANAGATYSGQPWYVPQLQSGQSLIDTTTGAATSARQMANDLAIAEENARLQAESIQNDRYTQELLRAKFQFGMDQYADMPNMAKTLLEQLGITGGTGSGGGAIDTASPFTQEAAQMRANAARSRASQSAASAQRGIAESMTGAGFGGSSPAIFANQLNAALQGAASGTANAEKIYSDYEDKNANFRLAAQVAASEAQDRQARQVLDWLQTQYSLLGQLMG